MISAIARRQVSARAIVIASGVVLSSLAAAGGLKKGLSKPTSTTTTTVDSTSTTSTSSGSTLTTTTTDTSLVSTDTTTSDPFSVELASIPSNFDVNSELLPSWGTGAIAGSASPDNVGAFRFICNPSHQSYDDPIVHPGQPGKSHLHQFFGNTQANASSTYESLRKTGNSTCNSPLNRSAYWMPAMMNGKGKVVRPDYISIYYKRYPAASKDCQPGYRSEKGCAPLPRGLRFVYGYNMNTMMADRRASGYFNCDGAGAVSGHFATIVDAAKGCPSGARLGAIISSPDCWDGKNLDSPDHRSHMSYSSYGSWGYLKCPSTHPYIIPTFTQGAWYTTDETLDRTGVWNGTLNSWHLASDAMHGMVMKPGSSFHADWFGAWDDTVMKMWTENCINKLLNCSAGDLGNGKQLKMFSGFTWNANPRVVDAPVS